MEGGIKGKKIQKQLFQVVLLAVLLASCTTAVQESETITPAATTTPSPTPSSVPTGTPTPSGPAPDLAVRPQIWFGPLDPAKPNASRPFTGERFFDLFEDDAPWVNARNSTHVFKLYGGWVAWEASSGELKRVVDYAEQHGMALAFEAGPLTPTDECTGEIEGFAGPREAIRIVEKIKAAGGEIVYVDLEHPYDAATFADAPASCKMTPEQIARNVSRFIETVRSVFPGAVFGAVETARHQVEHVSKWVEAYRSVLGEDLAYFHLDMDYGQPDWPQRALEIENYLHSQGIEFGLFYRGEWNAASDADWILHAEQLFVNYEVEYGGQPDHVIFQSWHPHPLQLLPETDPGAFTYLIDRYVRARTEISLEAGPSQDGGMTLSGVLVDSRQTRLANAPVLLTLKPIESPGLVFEYTLTGTVPENAIEADVGYRINLECNCSGPSDVVLYEVRYTEGDETGNRIPNPKFSQGYNGWGAWGDAAWKLVSSDLASGRALHITARPNQGAAINSAKFKTTPGATFQMVFVARVSPESQGSGYFNLIFANTVSEIKRFTIPLEAAAVPLGEVLTDADGYFSFQLEEKPEISVLLQAWYLGDQTYWPGFAAIQLPAE